MIESIIARVFRALLHDSAMAAKVEIACGMKRKGYSIMQIAQKMGVSESTVRNYLARGGMAR